jgi:C4-dicarboxylate-binding protein DctP
VSFVKKRSFLLIICLAVLTSLLALTVSDVAEAKDTKPEYEWRFAQPWVRPTNQRSYELFCDLVEQYTDGKMVIKLYPDGLLGTHDESFHAVQEGSVEIGVFAPYVNLVPGGMLNWMPWTISNFDEAMLAYTPPDGILYKVMEKAYNEVGMHMLFTQGQGAYGIGNNTRPIKTPEDFKNLKLRVSSSLGFVRALANMGEGSGMTLQTVPWADLYNALSRGVVDGCWSMWPSLVEERHYEVLKYYTALDFAWDANNVVINLELWEEIPQEYKDAITKAAKIAEEHQYELQRRAQLENILWLSQQPDFEIYFPTAEERAVFREKANMEAVWEELAKPWLEEHYPGENMTQKVMDELDNIREKVEMSY